MSSLPSDHPRGDRSAILLARAGVSMALSLGMAIPSPAPTAKPSDLTQLSLDDLMNVQVTSVSKKEQMLSKAGAAIFVINQEDIRRSGMTNIPDLLRLAPGVDVARLDANRWAISIRGFNNVFADKVLVLIDGRTVYLDSGSNVFWDQLDVPLEDIDRIEVIRGPGGTVWGANAVNGVINIITKNAKATRGGLVTGGTQDAHRCQILFIGAAEWKRTRAMPEGLQRHGVLTVGETDDFTALGGIIGFKLDGARVRIQIALETAERAKLRISSKLLNLAEIVKKQP